MFSVAYKIYREKTIGGSADENIVKNVPFFDRNKEEKDPETKYASLPDMTPGGQLQKPSSLQDDFEQEEEDI